MIKRLYEKNKYLPLFIAYSLVVLLIVVGVLIIFPIMEGGLKPAFAFISKYLMSDFGQVMYFTLSENPYVNNFPTMYLPLNFIFMYPFALICKTDPSFMKLDNISIIDGTYSYEELLAYNAEILSGWQFWVASISFFAICLAIIGLLVYRLRKWQSKTNFILWYGAVCFSAFFAFGLFRGTNVFIALIFILLFILLYKSEKFWQREIAYVCLAIAGVLKIYPLLFGVLLLKEKKFLESLRVALYSVIFAVLPFAIYGNVIENLSEFISNLFTFTHGENRMGDAMNISVFSFVCWLFGLFKLSGTFVSVMGYLITVILFGCCILVAIKSKSKFVATSVIAVGMLSLAPVSYYYVSMFMVIPLAFLLDEWKLLEKSDKKWYAIFYGIMSLVPLSATMWYIPQCVFMIILLVWETYKIFAKEDKKSDGETVV